MAAALCRDAPALPHPALERGALGHAAFLDTLTAGRDLLARQVLVAVREPTSERARRRIGDAARALAAADLAVTALDGPQTAAVLAACCTPGQPPPAASASAAPASQPTAGDGHPAPGSGGAR